jgi:4-amino-4-deoxy-L-arabinose transferase-like glycosyltransferase
MSPPDCPAKSSWSRRLTSPWAAAVVLAAFWALMVASLRHKGPTFDEPGHMVAGYAYWHLGDYRLDPENGNLPQRVAALPLLGGSFRFPDTDSDAWRSSDLVLLHQDWLFHQGNDPDAMLARSRAVCALFAVALAALVWAWSRRLFGPSGGMLSLALCVLSPTLLANGALATSDTAAALFLLASCGAWAWALERLSPARVLLSALVMGGLFITKGTAVLIVPVVVLMAVARLAGGKPRPRAGSVLVAAAAHVLVVAAVIWAAYGFRFSAFAPPGDARDHLADAWEEVTGRPLFPTLVSDLGLTDAQKDRIRALVAERGVSMATWNAESLAILPVIERDILDADQARRLEARRGEPPPRLIARALDLAYRGRLLPQAYLTGMAHVLTYAQVRESFLNGDYSVHGWVLFFPYTVLVKTPLAFFGIVLLAAAAWTCGRARPRLRGTLPLLLLLAVYWAAILRAPINIGHRHVLATYPPLFILCGAAAGWAAGGPRAARAALAALLVLLAASVLRCFPDYLAYFNVLAGGPDGAYRHLVDSSLDWGQDLPGVASYIEQRRPAGPAYLAYFGMGEPRHYRIPARLINSFGFTIANPLPLPLLPEPVPADDPDGAIARIAAANPEYEPVALAGDGPQRLALFLEKPEFARLGAGTYFVSATLLQSLEYNLDGPWGPWNDRYEATYRRLRARVGPILEGDRPSRVAALAADSVDGWMGALSDYEQYRFARLAAYLRHREPDDSVGHSILVYRLGEADLARALDGPPPERGRDVMDLLDASTRLGAR